MSSKDQMLSVAEVCELPAGDRDNASWINPGFTGTVRSIKSFANGDRYSCTIADTTGSATIEGTWFKKKPPFNEGDLIEISGKGLRRTEYNGKAQFALGKDTDVHVLGRSVHHEEQKERAGNTEPSVNGSAPTIAGQTVGMAMKESLALVGMAHGGITGMELLRDPLFWEDVKVVAGAIIRLSRSLEAGKLSPPPWPVKAKEQPAAPQPKPAAPAPKTSPQDERQAANLVDRRGQANMDEEVPF